MVQALQGVDRLGRRLMDVDQTLVRADLEMLARVLVLKGERITQYTFFSVGSGTGPDTVAPVRVAVSTISFAADSIAEVSYAFRRMRILFWVADAI